MSTLTSEDYDWLYVTDYLHNNSDSIPEWVLEHPQYVIEAEHYALYEVKVEYRINKHSGRVQYLAIS